MKVQFVSHGKHNVLPLQRPTGECCMGKLIFILNNHMEHIHTLCG